MARAFVASADLKPMAWQLLENRSPAGYAGVERYARRRAASDAGALAWLVIAYAHNLDREYAKSIEALKKAEARRGELDDYIHYFLAVAYAGTGDTEAEINTLRTFESKFPDSLFGRDALVMYGNALLASGEAQRAASALEGHRIPPRADHELALGRAYAAAGEQAKASEVLRRLYVTMPLSPEAEQANADLKALSTANPLPPLTFAERKTRADLLAQGRRYSEAAGEYSELLGSASTPEELASANLALGVALYRTGKQKEAREVLERIPWSADERNSQRLYFLSEIARSEGDEAGLLKVVSQLRENASTSPWFDDALLSGANMYLLKHDLDRAIDFYREIHERFPRGRHGPYAHWKEAWLSLRQGRTPEAARLFEEQIGQYPASGEVPPALYWRARLAEEQSDYSKARAYYEKLSQRFSNYYYAELARQRLYGLPSGGEPDPDPLLEKISPGPQLEVPEAELPPDNLRAQKSQLLKNGGLYDFAIRELQLASGSEYGANWATAEMARMYQESGRYQPSLELLKRAIPSYFSVEVESLPREYWQGLFPRPYWDELKKYSLQNRLDPYFVASLIRQESEFNPAAISRANAMGLMQLLPATGKKLAKEVKVGQFSSERLLDPKLNLQLGTRYFRSMMDHFDGRQEYALAAYNAGSDRVQEWLESGHYRDPAEFVESIPFTETREYVQAILRNATLYRKIYGNP